MLPMFRRRVPRADKRVAARPRVEVSVTADKKSMVVSPMIEEKKVVASR